MNHHHDDHDKASTAAGVIYLSDSTFRNKIQRFFSRMLDKLVVLCFFVLVPVPVGLLAEDDDEDGSLLLASGADVVLSMTALSASWIEVME